MPGLQPASHRVILIADNQAHDVLGGGAGIYKTGVADRYTKVALRPARLDLYGQDLLKETIRYEQSCSDPSPFFVHLGDACNVSTTSEFEQFCWTMQAVTTGWAMAPGNHDGYFFGNVSADNEAGLERWESASNPGGEPMQRDRFVAYYLAALLLQEKPWADPFATALSVLPVWQDIQQQGIPRPCDDPQEDHDRFLCYRGQLEVLAQAVYDLAPRKGTVACLTPAPTIRRVSWSMNRGSVWKSYLVQDLDLTMADSDAREVRMFLADTSVEWFHPKLKKAATKGKGPGVRGRASQGELDVLDSWAVMLDDAWLIVAAHHPLWTMELDTREGLVDLNARSQIPIFLSAHTHEGTYALQKYGPFSGGRPVVELNVGSILDWPIEYRDLQVWQSQPGPEGRETVAVSSHMIAMEQLLGWRAPPRSDEDAMTWEDAVGLILADATRRSTVEEVPSDFSIPVAIEAIRYGILNAYRELIRFSETVSGTWPRTLEGETLEGDASVLAEIDRRLDPLDVLGESGEHFLFELHRFVQTRRVREPERVRVFRLASAMAASHAEWVKNGENKSPSSRDDSRGEFEEMSTEDFMTQPDFSPLRGWTWGPRWLPRERAWTVFHRTGVMPSSSSAGSK